MFVAVPFLVLFWFMRPTVLANPGMSAHNAPPGTRLVPLPRKLESLELGVLPLQASVAESAQDCGLPDLAPGCKQPDVAVDYAQPAFIRVSAQQREAEKPAKREARAPNRKRTRLTYRRKYRGDYYAYARDLDGRRRWVGR
jgi:hypothetical protein